MKRAPTRWTIEEEPDGTCVLKLDGREVEEAEDEGEALGMIRSHRDGGRGTEVTFYAEDGYASRKRA